MRFLLSIFISFIFANVSNVLADKFEIKNTYTSIYSKNVEGQLLWDLLAGFEVSSKEFSGNLKLNGHGFRTSLGEDGFKINDFCTEDDHGKPSVCFPINKMKYNINNTKEKFEAYLENQTIEKLNQIYWFCGFLAEDYKSIQRLVNEATVDSNIEETNLIPKLSIYFQDKREDYEKFGSSCQQIIKTKHPSIELSEVAVSDETPTTIEKELRLLREQSNLIQDTLRDTAKAIKELKDLSNGNRKIQDLTSENNFLKDKIRTLSDEKSKISDEKYNLLRQEIDNLSEKLTIQKYKTNQKNSELKSVKDELKSVKVEHRDKNEEVLKLKSALNDTEYQAKKRAIDLLRTVKEVQVKRDIIKEQSRQISDLNEKVQNILNEQKKEASEAPQSNYSSIYNLDEGQATYFENERTKFAQSSYYLSKIEDKLIELLYPIEDTKLSEFDYINKIINNLSFCSSLHRINNYLGNSNKIKTEAFLKNTISEGNIKNLELLVSQILYFLSSRNENIVSLDLLERENDLAVRELVDLAISENWKIDGNFLKTCDNFDFLRDMQKISRSNQFQLGSFLYQYNRSEIIDKSHNKQLMGYIEAPELNNEHFSQGLLRLEGDQKIEIETLNAEYWTKKKNEKSELASKQTNATGKSGVCKDAGALYKDLTYKSTADALYKSAMNDDYNPMAIMTDAAKYGHPKALISIGGAYLSGTTFNKSNISACTCYYEAKVAGNLPDYDKMVARKLCEKVVEDDGPDLYKNIVQNSTAIITTSERKLASKCVAGYVMTMDEGLKSAFKNDTGFTMLALDLTMYGSQLFDLNSSQPDEFKKITAGTAEVRGEIKNIGTYQDLLPLLRDLRNACKPALKAYGIN